MEWLNSYADKKKTRQEYDSLMIRTNKAASINEVSDDVWEIEFPNGMTAFNEQVLKDPATKEDLIKVKGITEEIAENIIIFCDFKKKLDFLCMYVYN